MKPREFITGLKARWIMGLVVLIGMTTAVVIGAWAPAWMLVLLGSIALAFLYVAARQRSRYDPLDPRFGSCIPPMTMPRATDAKPPRPVRPDLGQQ